MKADFIDFPSLRRFTFSIAYRMLGSVADAEEIVQESFLRFHRAEIEGVVVESAKAYLGSVATRLAIDHLRSARVRRETYVGPWLTEPIVDEKSADIERHTEMAESLSMAFLMLLETLSSIERAVFLLREVFDFDYMEVAAIVEKTEDNCRRIFARAKHHIEAHKPRFEASREKHDEFAQRFLAACTAGQIDDFVLLLAQDVVI